jgi:nitroreductase
VSLLQSNAAIPPEAQSLFDVMATMRAMRRLNPDPVPDALLEQLVDAATWAPSASNAQAYEFIVVTNRAQMAVLAQLWRRCVDTYMASFGHITPATLDNVAADRLRRAIAYQRDHFHGMTGLSPSNVGLQMPKPVHFVISALAPDRRRCGP